MAHFSTLIKAGLSTILLVGIASDLHAQTITTFDVPNSASTYPTAINSAGQITGWGDGAFLRESDGTFTTFSVIQDGVSWATYAQAMNAAGKITGYFCTAHFTCHSFLRQTDGTFILFQISQTQSDSIDGPPTPLAFSGDGDGGNAINSAGWITGVLGQSHYVSYLWQPNGTYITFEVPPEGDVIPDTEAQAINRAGQITGFYNDVNGYRGFLRQRQGTILRFDVPGAIQTIPGAINAAGAITGVYVDATRSGGFLRKRDGTIIKFHVPDSTGTTPVAINTSGKIAGYYWDGTVSHGFTRDRDGTFVKFDVPDSTGTTPVGMNDKGQIAGWYKDANGGVHGFVREGADKICAVCGLVN